MKTIVTQYYECEVIKKVDPKTNGIRFENCGYNIKHKEMNKDFIKYNCLLTNSNKLRIEKSEIFKLTKESKHCYNGDIYTIYCDAGVHNYGNDNKSIELSALTTIIYKNNKEFFKTTNVYEQFLDNNTVEILALLIALRYLQKNVEPYKLRNSKIIVSSDSQNLQEYIIRPKIIKVVIKKCIEEKGSSYYSELMRELLNELNYFLSFLDVYSGWIKGHSQIKVNSSKETLMNNVCDRMCKEALRKKLNELKFDESNKENNKKHQSKTMNRKFYRKRKAAKSKWKKSKS